jgi:hypothetical protein
LAETRAAPTESQLVVALAASSERRTVEPSGSGTETLMAAQWGLTLAFAWAVHWERLWVEPWAESTAATLDNRTAALLADGTAAPTASSTVDSKGTRSVVHWAAP